MPKRSAANDRFTARGSLGTARCFSLRCDPNKALLNFLVKLGLKDFYPNKLNLRSLFEINKNKENIEEDNDLFDEDFYCTDDSRDDKINPLDLIVALFHCADSILQQEMALKMSMCQFSLPLLLPRGHKSQCTLMLWALRDIVKDVEESEHRILSSLQDVKSKLFLVVNRKGGNASEEMMSVKRLVKEIDLPKNRVKVKDYRLNVAEFSKKLCEVIKASLLDVKDTMSIVDMVGKAVELGLSVDESKTNAQRKAAEEIMDDIKVRSIPHYKKLNLTLQGANWKRLSKLEMEECRLKKSGDSGPEDYKRQLQEEKRQIRQKQQKCDASKGMKSFIKCLSTSDKEERDVFLKWMKLKFNTRSRVKLSVLRHKFKEQCKKKDVKLIAELDQALVDSSLGTEHYMREMGLIYEFSTSSSTTADEITHLPGLAADMLLDGYPLELLDGDASNVPERWVTDVLMELHKKIGHRSRLLVLTVLGVQSSGKSTLLNTMFGVQFPVSSGRCTRGAFMLFLKVAEDLKSELNCDFIVLIDTEGLRSPDLAQLEDSYEQDNQLATFVIGLSDVTIINIAMENSAEMKDVLQIAVHAFLRMKEIGKKSVCHFVHQNISSVSAHDKNMTERKHLLDQLNEMTQIAAQMEKKPIKEFTDVLDYDMDKNNWNIPGLWHGTPPMAPVNTGYSEAVAELKKNLLQTGKKDPCNEVSQIPEFLEWMKSLWQAVKYENFIFSFRNTLVAQAYDNLFKEFNQWEWEFRKEILTWQTQAEKVMKLLGDCEASRLTEEELTQEFEKMWAEATVDLSGLKERDIAACVLKQLRKHFCNQNVNEALQKCLKSSMKELKDQLEEEFSNSDDITEILNKLPIKPQDELFKQVFGCGRLCPFCKAPCEAGGKEHKQHHAAIHRPQGLGRVRCISSKKLVDSLCTTDVHSDGKFRNSDSKWELHPYKDYNKYYPDWIIPPDPTPEASDYWKYVLVKYNDRFAEEYEAEQADVPEAWRRLTKEQALKGLSDAFNMK
ncbi:unnamed protein product [Pleuronectes platessa]|uniref:VLIG-type G domain-containing protein n=1 Tax=Pleuronectes platessa TaxID=8262 RepID=A0A9N7YTZ5_PLEPL|nr:unnamed protein product [Pleuronectes platessa]